MWITESHSWMEVIDQQLYVPNWIDGGGKSTKYPEN